MFQTLAIALVTLGLTTSVMAGNDSKSPAMTFSHHHHHTMAQRLKLDGERATKLDALEESFKQDRLALREKHKAKLAELLTKEELASLALDRQRPTRRRDNEEAHNTTSKTP